MARGGWANQPHVIWEDRSEIEFSMQEGVMSSVSMGILLSANVLQKGEDEHLYVPKREGPFEPLNLNNNSVIYITHQPVQYPAKKLFILEYDRDVAQRKIYCTCGKPDILGRVPLTLYEDKNCTTPADNTKQYLVDYYYEYENDALIYSLQKERFNGLFTLEGKFYSKDENEGKNYTNIMYMPKVRVVSDINLRLGERANPTMSVFNIIGMPENMGGNKKGLIMEITRLDSDIDGTI